MNHPVRGNSRCRRGQRGGLARGIRRTLSAVGAGWLLLLAAAFLSAAGAEGPLLHGYELTYNDESSPYLVRVWTCPDNFINTDLAYDPQAHVLYCAHFTWEQTGESIETLRKRDGARLADPIPVNPHMVWIQGLAYKASDDTFWAWGDDGDYTQRWAYHFTRAGELLPGDFNMPGLPGSLDYDSRTGSLWSKENWDGQLRRYTEAGTLVEIRETGVGGEGLARDPFDDTFWFMEDQTIWHLELGSGDPVVLGAYPNPCSYYPPDTLMGYYEDGESEGLAVDTSDHTLWLAADQTVHGGIPDGNRCWQINPLDTYNRRVTVPGGLVWAVGRLVNTEVRERGLQLEPAAATGFYLSPVVDLGEYRALRDSLCWEGPGAVWIEYRGSDAAPSGIPLDNLTLPYYDANGPQEGWGSTMPPPWSDRLPEARFVQVRIHLADVSSAPEAVWPCAWPGAEPIFGLRGNPAIGRVHLVLSLDGRAGQAGDSRADQTAMHPREQVIDLAVFDPAGRAVRRFSVAPDRLATGTLCWDGRDDHGRRLPAGRYVIRAQTSQRHTVRSVLLIPR